MFNSISILVLSPAIRLEIDAVLVDNSIDSRVYYCAQCQCDCWRKRRSYAADRDAYYFSHILCPLRSESWMEICKDSVTIFSSNLVCIGPTSKDASIQL
jgi:hypothetical protein